MEYKLHRNSTCTIMSTINRPHIATAAYACIRCVHLALTPGLLTFDGPVYEASAHYDCVADPLLHASSLALDFFIIPAIAFIFMMIRTTQSPAVAVHKTNTPNTSRARLVKVSLGRSNI